MAKADRLARLDDRRLELEAEYTAALIAALRVTAAGKWGLFDHNGDRAARAAVAPVVDELEQLGHTIDQARDQLGMSPFELHQEFLSSRGPVGPEAVGEPKQAKAWLDRLAPAGVNVSSRSFRALSAALQSRPIPPSRVPVLPPWPDGL